MTFRTRLTRDGREWRRCPHAHQTFGAARRCAEAEVKRLNQGYRSWVRPPKPDDCPKCDGTGRTATGAICSGCHGTGRKLTADDRRANKAAAQALWGRD